MQTQQRIGTYALISREDNRILFIKRAANDSFPHFWELPGGGIAFGEDPQKGVEREAFEETGLTVTAVAPLTVITHVSADSQLHFLRIVYLCRLVSNPDAITLSDEHSAFLWIHPTQHDDELKKTAFVQEIFRQLAESPYGQTVQQVEKIKEFYA